jgi:hypothetical protein
MNDEDPSIYLKVYKGKYFTLQHDHSLNYRPLNIYGADLAFPPRYKKVVAFDMDETMGSFMDLDIIWQKVQYFDPPVLFHHLLDLYPEFIRYGILSILDFLYQKKKTGECEYVYIYTNNQCSQEWVKLITDYFHYKLNCQTVLFDQTICAFKINNRRVEFLRTTHSKTYDDFLKCTLLPKSTEICFVDNSYFVDMNTERVYYIKPRSYYHSLSTKDIVNRFLQFYLPNSSSVLENHGTNQQIETVLKHHFEQYGRVYDYLPRYLPHRELDILVAQKMMYHIKEFFYIWRKGKTRKNKWVLSRFTRKRK